MSTMMEEQLELFDAQPDDTAVATSSMTPPARVRQIATVLFQARPSQNAAVCIRNAAERVAYDELRTTEEPAGAYGSWSAAQHAHAHVRQVQLRVEALDAGPFGDPESAAAMVAAAKELRVLARSAPDRARDVLRQKALYLESEAAALVTGGAR